jgi:hypothetical protein
MVDDLGSRHLLMMVTLIFLTLITSQIADWQLMDAVRNSIRVPTGRRHQRVLCGSLVTNTPRSSSVPGRFRGQRFGILATIIFLPASPPSVPSESFSTHRYLRLL